MMRYTMTYINQDPVWDRWGIERVFRPRIKIPPAFRYEITARCYFCGYEPEDCNELIDFHNWAISSEFKMYPKECPQCLENDFIEYIYTASLIPTD